MIEGVLYDSKGIDAIGKLPSKKELYAKIAGGISAVPAKLAGTVKEVPQKTSRAIKLAFAPEELDCYWGTDGLWMISTFSEKR